MSEWGAADFAAPSVVVEARKDGAVVLRSGYPLERALPLVTERLAFWAEVAPDRAAFVECRNGTLARSVSYRETAALSARFAAGLRRYPLSPERPLLIVAENGIDHALLRIAAMRVGVPFAPVSPNLLRLPGGEGRLVKIVRALNPGLVYADDATALSASLREAGSEAVTVLGRNGEAAGTWATLLAAGPVENLAAVESAISPDTIAAIFFTSGSTGTPKGVITTHRMLSANQCAIAILWPFLRREPPRLLDWLPWHHTFGGNDNFNKMLWHGGTLYIDDGRPTPEAVGRSIANLKAVAPTIHINVPRGLELLLDAIDRDPDARVAFLRALRLIFFAGAGLSRATWDRLRALVDGHAAAGGGRIALVSGWGATECGSTICLVHFPIDGPRAVGLPLPGYELKLVPAGAKREACVRGPNVTPGYWPRADRDRSAFDEEGYYRTGDAARLLDPNRAEAGLAFDGRVAEDFKLSTGTWVSVGPLRLALLAALAPLARDVAVAGHDERFIGILIFLDLDACRRACELGADACATDLAASTRIRSRIAEAIRAYNVLQPGSSTAIGRAILIAEAPSDEAGETNEKGYLNQQATLLHREKLVGQLFSEEPSARVISF